MKGELHPTKNRFVRRTLSHMDRSVERIDLFSAVATSRGSKWAYYLLMPHGCLTTYTTTSYEVRSFPLCVGGGWSFHSSTVILCVVSSSDSLPSRQSKAVSRERRAGGLIHSYIAMYCIFSWRGILPPPWYKKAFRGRGGLISSHLYRDGMRFLG